MKKVLAVAAAVVLLQAASAAQAGISFSINVGGPPVVVAQPPDFLYPPELGFGVAVGVPYDMFYLSNAYFIFRGGGWYRTDYYGGPWIKVRPRELPPELRRYRMRRIHEFRDREYRMYSRDRNSYRGRYFRPTGERREEHREMREQRRDERRDMKELRRDEHQQMKEQRRDEHQQMKEQRREMKDERRDERGGGDRR
ncbi:hypothetical protein [Geobacter sp. AOG2]|uniref:hypothetical protein n=1 Tax=Geobacter sp. AOG2 TaxID=1566347 RepID=UPI001CC432EA|nr:hypothetical protein [Geobacter sp. AOG2]GFE60574.1 hypothetical protein AOG2_11620 [Geobacter sp. AOG2]